VNTILAFADYRGLRVLNTDIIEQLPDIKLYYINERVPNQVLLIKNQ